MRVKAPKSPAGRVAPECYGKGAARARQRLHKSANRSKTKRMMDGWAMTCVSGTSKLVEGITRVCVHKEWVASEVFFFLSSIELSSRAVPPRR